MLSYYCNMLSYYWKPFFTGCFRYSCRRKQLFCVVETYFFKESFILAGESEFLPIENSSLLFTAFILFMETIISSEIHFH